MNNTVTVVIVDDHEIVRVGLKALLADLTWVKVVAEAATAEEALEQIGQHRPEIALMDIRLPGMSGIEACRQIRGCWPEVQVLMLTSYGDEGLVHEAMNAGACTYVLKQVGNRRLVAMLDAVRRGQKLASPGRVEEVVERIRREEEAEQEEVFQDLTPREMEVLAAVAQGRTNAEIAEQMEISYKTARNYVSAIIKKLQLNSRVEAIHYARRHTIERYLS